MTSHARFPSFRNATQPQRSATPQPSVGGLVYYVVGQINEVTLRQTRLVLGWVTVYGRVNHLGK